MDTVVLKFGGSSVADNIKLNIVADKVKEFYKNNKVVVVVSAQGKTTDLLIKEAYSLSKIPDERELDVLLSTGEQITMAKLSILLNRLEIPAISLSGWQAGIYTNNTNQDAIIEKIDVSRIENELNKNRVVVVAGFQGINENNDITTLGRGGSDTTAVSLAAKLKAKHCYIFSDVDGIYTSDPNKITIAKKIENLSYKEMIDIANEGAKVLHKRCVEIGEKFDIPIIAKSTFKDGCGTIINNNKIEENEVKNIIKNDNILLVSAFSKTQNINCIIPKDKFNKLSNLFEEKFKMINCTYTEVSKISIIGNSISNNNLVLNSILNIINKYNLEIFNMEINESKISIIFKSLIEDFIIEELHKDIIF